MVGRDTNPNLQIFLRWAAVIPAWFGGYILVPVIMGLLWELTGHDSWLPWSAVIDRWIMEVWKTVMASVMAIYLPCAVAPAGQGAVAIASALGVAFVLGISTVSWFGARESSTTDVSGILFLVHLSASAIAVGLTAWRVATHRDNEALETPSEDTRWASPASW